VTLRRAALVLLSCAAACRPGEPEPAAPRPVPLPGREPIVRIGITVDSTVVTVSAPQPFDFVRGSDIVAQGDARESWTIGSTADGRLEGTSANGRTTGPHAGVLRVVPRQGGIINIGDRAYRGEALLRTTPAGRVTAINVVQLEQYLLGVVPREIGRGRPAAEIEAVKAQAVAARTYAIGNRGARDALGFDFYATVLDQVYGGLADEDSIVSRAVRETRGEILTHSGVPIIAYYSSTCGGRTAAIEDAWPWRAPLPYLRSVSDYDDETGTYFCQSSSRFAWTTAWTRDQLLAVLAQSLALYTRQAVRTVTRVNAVELIDTTASGTARVRLTADDVTYVLRADSLRWVLRPQPGPAILNSARLRELNAERGVNEVTRLEIRGAGWGHAIGMCQVGALGRARRGQRYDRILTTYYSGTQLQRLY
jgi:stage II sporulation protein D